MKRATIAMVALTAALMLVLGASTAQAQEQEKAKKGKVQGVVKKEGKPVEGVRVALMKPMQRGPGAGPGPGAGGGGGGQARPQAFQQDERPGPGEGRRRPAPVAETKTDAKGRFHLEAEAGEYMLAAGERGSGMARQRVTIKAGETQDVELTLEDPPARPDRPGRPGQPGRPGPARD